MDTRCREVVRTSWEESRGRPFTARIRQCGHNLQVWGGDIGSKLGGQIKQAKERLERLRDKRDASSMTLFVDTEKRLNILLDQEEAYWRQRAKQHWMQGGDSNSKFFHNYASLRRKRNHINHLRGTGNIWLEGDALKPLILDYFQNIFTTEGSTEEDLTSIIEPRITNTQNALLTAPFVVEEIRTAVFAMAPNKAPGPDGMTPSFYQNFWTLLDSDVTNFIMECLNSDHFPDNLNDATIVLIPKKAAPKEVTDLRPIALCNVVYKIIANVLANRMKKILDDTITETQSAFVPGRLITDNMLIAAEVGHFLHNKRSGITGWTGLKLDMVKAYDRMEWPFLERMLRKLGFAETIVKKIMLCVTTGKYNILINGELAGPVIPTRGLRQGDPLSPYLFIMCAEGLSCLLSETERNGGMHGCRVARAAPPITHLFFTDDSLLFFKANKEEAEAVKECLRKYDRVSIEYCKSLLNLSRNVLGSMHMG